MSASAKAIVTYGEHDWRLEDVTVKEPGEEELIVKMVASGVCHTGGFCLGLPGLECS